MRDPKKTLEAATAMKLTSKNLLELKIIDEIIIEPSGGAHRNRDEILSKLKESLIRNLNELTIMSRQEIINHRKNKFLNIGRNQTISNGDLSSDELFSGKVNKIFNVKNKIKSKKTYIFGLIVVTLILFLLFIQS